MKPISKALDQYSGIFKEAIITFCAKLSKSLKKWHLVTNFLQVISIMSNFTYMDRSDRDGMQFYHKNIEPFRLSSHN